MVQKSAEQDFAAAQYDLGACYLNGLGVEEDEKRALYWVQKAAEQDYADAQVVLGNFYSEGIGAEKMSVKLLNGLKKRRNKERRKHNSFGMFLLCRNWCRGRQE